jgi:ParB-like chromosome segregation protein Spo0J
MKTAKRMRIASIKPIRSGRIDPKLVAAYRQMLREGKKAPPIDLGERTPDGRWQLLDGRHRLKAAILEGAKTIMVDHRIVYE